MKMVVGAITIAGLIILGALMFVKNNGSEAGTQTAGNNVTVVDGVQIIEITARGGFNPRVSEAKAGIPTVLKFKTNGTFDCSSSVRIASLNINKILPQTGTTDIDIGTPKAGALQGTCGMGMYPFKINFQS